MKSRLAQRLIIALAIAIFLVLVYDAILHLHVWGKYLFICIGLGIVGTIGWLSLMRDHRRYHKN
jgi:hypothetical protein